MSQKVRKTLIMIVMAALIICLMAASLTYTFTYGRYAGGKFNSTESPYDDLIEFVGAREYTVRSPEELIQAIKDGYSNIVIAEDAEEPFVITEGVTDVEANLVLNLNGKVVVRNSRNPMLDVQTNVSVVLVYDSKQTGAFYNPVGSSLMASGGSLTVGSGGYESGPRAEEYENGTAAGTLGDTANATLFARSNETNNAVSGPTKLDRSKYVSDYSLVSGVSLPTITPKTTQENGRTSVRGNVYLSSNHSDWLPADTFLVYTVEENCFIGNGQTSGGVTFTKNQLYVNAESEKVGNVTTVTASEFTKPLCNVASCDFYYYYPIDKEGNPIDTAGTADSPQDYAVIYGYWDVMALAQDDKKNETDEKGMATALKDSGLIYPYGAVRMVEGEGIVRGGTFSNHFDAVNTYGIYAEGGTLSVSKNTTVDTTFTTGGEGVCIRVQSAEAETTTTGGSLTISGGEFSSEIGNTIEMSGGKMTVTKGTFTKNASVEGAASGEGANNGSAIDIQGGTLTMTGSDAKSFTITGSHVNGVRVEGADDTTATATIENATFNFNEGEGSNSVAGVRSFGGTLTVRYSTFNISNGATSGKTITRAAGLSTQGGTVTATTCIFNFAQENATVFPTASAGISSLGGTVTATDSTFTIPGNNNYGIYSSITSGVTGEGQYDTTATNCTFTMTGNSNHGIYAAGGKTLASGGTITLIGSGQNSDNFGIYSQSGTTTAEGCTITITGTYSAGALSYNGTIYLNDNTVIKVTESGVSTGDNTLLTSSAVSSEASTSGDHPINMNGNVTITSDGLGITARGNINVQSGKTTITTERATGIYVQGGILTVLEKAVVEVNSEIDSTCSWVVPPEHTDDESLQTNIYNGVFVNGGSLISNGTLNVTFTGVQNDAFGDGDNSGLKAETAYYLFKTKSYAVRVEGSGDTTVRIASGNITNAVGGGVLVNGGKVTLGREGEGAYTADENGNSSGLTVETTGYGLEDTNRVLVNNESFDSWIYRCTTTGGDAVKIDGGTLKILGGQYQTAHGNGIFVRGAQAAEEDAYAVEISGGAFRGYNSSEYGENADLTGPAQSYGIKIIGGKVLVNGGTFGSSNVTRTNGSAFFMGLPDEEAEIKIQRGNFYSKNTDAVATFRYTDITFEDLSDNNQNINISVTADRDRAAVALQDDQLFSQGDRSSTVTINGGTYTANGFGVWYGCSQDNLVIQDGIFTGSNTSGLYFQVNPGNNVQLSGGTYKGSNGAINANSPGSISTGNICWGIDGNGNRVSSWLYEDEELNTPITYEQVRLFQSTLYHHVGGNYGVDLNGYLSSLTVASSKGRLNEKKNITISTSKSNGDFYH